MPENNIIERKATHTLSLLRKRAEQVLFSEREFVDIRSSLGREFAENMKESLSLQDISLDMLSRGQAKTSM